MTSLLIVQLKLHQVFYSYLQQTSQFALVQVATDLTDNVFINAVIAFADGLSDEPD